MGHEKGEILGRGELRLEGKHRLLERASYFAWGELLRREWKK